ncbi:MAG: hypothetical protein ACLU38_07875 [Dysosmobacter sp.]
MTLFDALNALYEKYGWYAEKTHNLVMPGLDGLRDMAKLMKNLRENPRGGQRRQGHRPEAIIPTAA